MSTDAEREGYGMSMLPYDYSRCPGVGSNEEGWREGCGTCLRRLSPGRPDGPQVFMAPPPIIAFDCEYMIAPEANL